MKRCSSPSHGFTLVELLVVIVIVSISLGLGAPAFRQTIATQRIKNASFDLFSALNYARSEAVSRNAIVSVKAGALTASTDWTTGWRVVNGAGSVLRSWGATSNLSITEVSSPAITTVSFDNTGRLSTSAPKLQVAPSTSMSGVSTRCVSVDLSGRPNTAVGSCS